MHLHQGISENFQIIAHQASGLIKWQFCSNMLQFYLYLLVIIIKKEKKYQSPGFELARYTSDCHQVSPCGPHYVRPLHQA